MKTDNRQYLPKQNWLPGHPLDDAVYAVSVKHGFSRRWESVLANKTYAYICAQGRLTNLCLLILNYVVLTGFNLHFLTVSLLFYILFI